MTAAGAGGVSFSQCLSWTEDIFFHGVPPCASARAHELLFPVRTTHTPTSPSPRLWPARVMCHDDLPLAIGVASPFLFGNSPGWNRAEVAGGRAGWRSSIRWYQRKRRRA